MSKTIKNIKARILVEIAIGLAVIQPNRVIAGPEYQINALVKAGVADAEPAAIEYALSENSEVLEPFVVVAEPEQQTDQTDQTSENA